MIKLEILESKTEILFQKLAKEGLKFPLVGGTGLSLQLGHRKSLDLDFAVPRYVTSKDYQIFKKISKDFELVYQSKEQVDMFVDGVKVTLFSYRWKELFKKIEYKKLVIWDMKDIAVSKAYSIGRRSELKDYVDLYFILKEGVLTLEDLVKYSKEKYGGEFSEKLFLQQLLLIKQTEPVQIKYLRDAVDVNEIDLFFENLVKKYTDE